ncbi:hypothetical protein VTJ49DRAFT_4057 [Mycothermus thermophilus]|uniref:Rhodopsin domain-containing protein n=1 Tax=Humicola insolens TaxID=85995 RepID=A0ABR3V6F4_HUMIN
MSSPTTSAPAGPVATGSALTGPVGGAADPIDPSKAGESNTEWIMAVLTIFHLLALTFVGLRVYARAVIIKTFGKDDILMVLSALCALVGYIVFCVQAPLGLGKHQWTISPENFVKFQHAGFIQSTVSAGWALGFLKISIGFNLLRLSTSRWYTWSLWISIVFVFCYTVLGMMVFLVQCKPMAAAWDRSVPAKCMELNTFITFALLNTGFNIFTDVLFASLPIPIVWTLQMKRKVKIYLIIILSLGYIAVSLGIVKAVYQIAFSGERDRTFYQSIQFWGFLQLQVGIMAACATSLKPLFARVLKLNSTERYYGNNAARRYYASKGTKLTDQDPTQRSRAGEYELESAMRISEEEAAVAKPGGVAHGPGETFSTATSFYKHNSSPNASGSEEMILAPGQVHHHHGMGATRGLSPHALTTDDGRGIMMTTEVRVSVKDTP